MKLGEINNQVEMLSKAQIQDLIDLLILALADKQPLSTVLSNTTASYTTDIHNRLANTTGTNSGDNATNTQYSGLATSKQDVLVSGTNIKTINGASLLGSGDITISGGGGGTPVYETNIDGQIFTGTIAQFVVTAGHTLAGVYAYLLSLPTGGNVTIQVYKNGLASTNSIFTSDTPLSITTTTSATNGVYSVLDTAIDNGSLVAGDVVYIVITAVGSVLPGSDLYIKAY